MTWWHALILGLVEGITEFLPVSSTGHLILTASLLGLDKPALKDAVDDFNIIIQGGAILAVIGVYWPRITQMVRGLLGRNPDGAALLFNLVVAFLPAAVVAGLLGKVVKHALFHPGPVIAALFIGGVFMMWLDAWRRGRFGLRPMGQLEVTELSIRQAFLIGCIQCIAIWPGTSRSMVTIAGGYMAGLKPSAAAEFSFLLGLPTLGAACTLGLYKNLSEAHKNGTPNIFETLGFANTMIGMAVAAVSAAIAVKWLVGFLNRRGLTPFGWYRIVLCLVLGVMIWRGGLTIAPG